MFCNSYSFKFIINNISYGITYYIYNVCFSLSQIVSLIQNRLSHFSYVFLSWIFSIFQCNVRCNLIPRVFLGHTYDNLTYDVWFFWFSNQISYFYLFNCLLSKMSPSNCLGYRISDYFLNSTKYSYAFCFFYYFNILSCYSFSLLAAFLSSSIIFNLSFLTYYSGL